MLKKIKTWISAMRLRTLPLALSCIICGSALCFSSDCLSNKTSVFSKDIFLLACLTTICLQILSNLANDYGDSKKGTDNEKRIGPIRAVQSGEISLESMKVGVIIAAICSLLFGIILLFVAFGFENWMYTLSFLILGLAAIVAAIKYTVGKNAYGYNALGDLFVFIFFGLVGVIGVRFLFDTSIQVIYILPAITIGGLSAGVLNLNNMRDIENDTLSYKITLAIKLGLQKAKIYHVFIIVGSLLCMLTYTLLQRTISYQSFIYVFAFPLFIVHSIKVMKNNEHKAFNPMLPMLAISTFILSILFFISCYL